MGFARINPLRFISGPFCGTYRPFAVLSWEHTTDTPYMGFFTGDGPANRGFNATYFVVFDVSKMSKYCNSCVFIYFCFIANASLPIFFFYVVNSV